MSAVPGRVPARTRSERWRAHALEAALFLAVGAAYLAAAWFAEGSPAESYHNAVDLIEWERRLHIFIEPHWSAWIRPHGWLIDVANFVYFWGHAPVLVVFFLSLYLLKGRAPGASRGYSLFRTGFVVSEFIGIGIYMLFPVMPPRLLPADYGVIDTLTLRSGINYTEGDFLVNTYAAFPSLHFAWIVLVSAALVRMNTKLLPLGFALPFVSFASIVVTGNHYVLDAVGGLLVAGIGLTVALGLPDERVAAIGTRALQSLHAGRRPRPIL